MCDKISGNNASDVTSSVADVYHFCMRYWSSVINISDIL